MARRLAQRLLTGLEFCRIAAILVGRFLVDMVRSSLVQARLVLRSPSRIRPQWVCFQTELRTRTARTVLGAVISMTPGTLTCDLEDDTLWLHVLSDRQESDVADRIRERFEAPLLELEEL